MNINNKLWNNNKIEKREDKNVSLILNKKTIKSEQKDIKYPSHKHTNNVRGEKANLIKLLQKGDFLIKELNTLIIKKKKLIKENKLNNLFSFLLSNNSTKKTNPLLNKNLKASINNQTPADLLLSSDFRVDNNNNNYLRSRVEEGVVEIASIPASNQSNNQLTLQLQNILRNACEKQTIKNGEKEQVLMQNSEDIKVVESENTSKPILNQYLKTMSTYNMGKKGILITYNNQIEYSFVAANLVFNNKIISNIYNLLQASFKSMYCLISKPVFVITPEKIIIRLFYFLFIPNILKFKKLNNNSFFSTESNSFFSSKHKIIKKQYNKFRKIKTNNKIKLRNLSNITLIKIFSSKFKILSSLLSKMFKKPVEFYLIRLHYPYNDSNILVNLLGIMVNKIKLRIIIRKLYENAVIKNLSKKHSNNINTVNIPAFLSGIKIKIGGRLLTQSVIPKKTVKVVQRGAIQRGKINFLDVARYTNKNKRGAFSIIVKSGQNIL